MGKRQKKSSGFDYAAFEKAALEGLKEGKDLVGEEGILKELMSHLVQSSLEGEMNYHLEQEKERGITNRRNGSTKKRVKTNIGEISIEPPRDRSGNFEPSLIGKWDRTLNSGFDNQVIELYSIGNSLEDIQMHLKRMYGVHLSTGQLSAITEQVRSDIEKWQSRPLKTSIFYYTWMQYTSKLEKMDE